MTNSLIVDPPDHDPTGLRPNRYWPPNMTSDLRKTPKPLAWFPAPHCCQACDWAWRKKKPPAGEGGRFCRNKPAMLIAPSPRNRRWLEKTARNANPATRQQPLLLSTLSAAGFRQIRWPAAGSSLKASWRLTRGASSDAKQRLGEACAGRCRRSAAGNTSGDASATT